jgi:hypothetical protein
VTSMEGLLQQARRLDLSSVEGRFRLGELAEALHCQLPTVADLHERLALDLELDPDTLTEAWYVASAFPSLTRHPGLPWTAYVTLRFHPQRHELADRTVQEHWDRVSLDQQLGAWFSTIVGSRRSDHRRSGRQTSSSDVALKAEWMVNHWWVGDRPGR